MILNVLSKIKPIVSHHQRLQRWYSVQKFNLGKFSSLVDIKPEIYDALHTNWKPVVALESTIITHGMPPPQNLSTALEVEQIVRQQNAIPATIAILDGRIKVGLSRAELEKLSEISAGPAVKTSRRDMAYVLANRLNGGTTVAGTLMVAQMVGIKIFATGGIGGVHRDFNATLDVSADLVELGRAPVAVVCAGVKSILDIPRTLELLETQGVLVAAYQSVGNEFPAFYTRRSGCRAAYGFDSAQQAARVIKTSLDMDLGAGMLIGVPVPEEFAMDEKQINQAIAEAIRNAESQGITGKEITPFILAAVTNITSGRSLQTNIALIKNNAKVAAEIASELHSLTHHGIEVPKTQFVEFDEIAFLPKNAPVIIGGSNIDTCITILDDDIKMNGATYGSRSSVCCGGVGRNLAEGVSKILGGSTFISAVGDDQNGNFIKTVLHPICNTEIVTEKEMPTANCSVTLDKFGECKMILAMNMAVHRSITPDLIFQNESLIKSAPLVVVDANLSVETMQAILEIAKDNNRPVFYEPTDMSLAEKPFVLPTQLYTQIKFASPNLYELRKMAKLLGFDTGLGIGGDKKSLDPAFIDESEQGILAEVTQLAQFMSKTVDNLIITLGSLGVVIGRFQPATAPFFDKSYNYNAIKQDTYQLRYYPSEPVNNIVNVSGAGDSFSSGFIAAMLHGLPEEVCISVGFEAATSALHSKNAVADFYFDRTHSCWSTAKPFQPLKLF